ncbi:MULTISPECIES: guanylate kinase [Spiroplasma]|uniref:Guanylate kinase n=1 Tax=Spiroplasma eriocheiris TaxID=315358 RepID=A0A0H3XIW9_9MOLU|nr:guanylate kinase [Spiroplasma eriocheiris]AHF58028.1 putative guanylate kinase [Spiroplasma eriocheiris CCTCC M 207170]AKM54470.1 guanylate kinase [Spiroplasma eriocheiris]
MNNHTGFLIIFSGPSGVGKGTIGKELFKYDDLHLAYSVSMTTREKREGEVDGINYFFVTKEEFQKAIANDELLEYAQFVGNYYGTPKAYCDKQLAMGKNVLLEIEVQGATQVLQKVPDALSIFLVPPSLEVLEARIRGRGTEPEEVLRQRMQKAREELPLQDNYDYVIVNDTVERATNEIVNIIRQEIKKRSTPSRG